MCEILFLKSCLFSNCDSLLKFVCKNFQLIRKTESEAEINYVRCKDASMNNDNDSLSNDRLGKC
jgi:hypothetical protein